MNHDFERQEEDHYNRQAFSPGNLSRTYDDRESEVRSSSMRAAHFAWLNEIAQVLCGARSKILDYCCGQGHHTVTLQLPAYVLDVT